MVKALVRQSVDRWRWKLAESQFPALRTVAGRGPIWEPIAKLLKIGRWGTKKGGQWSREGQEVISITAGEKASLKSAVVGGQWPQDRLFKAGLTDHPNCVLCAAQGVETRGTLLHRCMKCKFVEEGTSVKRPEWIRSEWDEL